jgi:hypothetical protein
MPNSTFGAAARKLARSHFPLTPGDDMPIELTLGDLATFAEEAMTQAAGRLDGLKEDARESYDTVYRLTDAVGGIINLLSQGKDTECVQAAELLYLVRIEMMSAASHLEMVLRDAESEAGGCDTAARAILYRLQKQAGTPKGSNQEGENQGENGGGSHA